MHALWTDLRFATRTLRRRAAAHGVAVLSLALAIGATTTVYALVDAMLIDPLPVAAPEQLVRVYYGTEAQPQGSWTYADYVHAAQAAPWAQSAATAAWQVSLVANGRNGDDGARLVDTALVSTSYFSTLGVEPMLGRAFTPSDPAAPGASDGTEAVLGYRLWQTAFGGDPSVVGRFVHLNGHAFEVVGVAPRGFHGTRLDEPAQLWLPLGNYRRTATGFFAHFDAVAFPKPTDGSRLSMWDVVARLPHDVSVTRAAAGLDPIARAVNEASGLKDTLRLTLEPLRSAALPSGGRGDGRRFLGMLFAAVGALFAVACLNVANLLIARGVERRSEIGLRLALGGRPSRIVRQLLTESLLMALAAGLLGLLVATWSLDLLGGYRLPGDVAVASLGLGLEPRVFLAGLLASLVACGTFGIVPAIATARRGAYMNRETGATGAHSDRSRAILIAVQVGFTLTLLVGAGLFLRAVDRALSTDLGFSSEGVLALTLDPSMAGIDGARAGHAIEALTTRARALPGVEAIALTSTLFGQRGFSQDGVFLDDSEERTEVHVAEAWIGPGYFDLMGIAHLSGRDIDDRDGAHAPPVVIINRTMAETLWPGESAIGKRARFRAESPGGTPTWTEVIGVVADSRYWHLDQQGQAFAYFPIAQHPQSFTQGQLSILVKHDEAANPTLPLRSLVAETAPALPIVGVRSMDARVAALVMPERLGRLLLACFALIAVLIAAGGIAAVVAQGVARRQREIGVRLALGADDGAVVGLFVKRALWPTLWGLVGGLAMAAAASRSLESFLHGVEPFDPLTFAVSACAFLTIALVASLLPARAAARVDPMHVLRSE